MNGIEGATFRANLGYELVLLDRLATHERELLGEAALDPDLYGVLRPRPGSTSKRAPYRPRRPCSS